MADDIITREDASAQGLKSYFTGMPCLHGHVARRQVAGRGRCLECLRLASIDWKRRNRERSVEGTRLWKIANPAAAKQWHVDNRESSRAACKRYYAKNKDAAFQRASASGRTRKARKRGLPGSHTPTEAAALYEAQGGCCIYCKADLRTVVKHLDHIMPLALGGSNDIANLQWLCAPCNLAKGAKDPAVFAIERGLLT